MGKIRIKTFGDEASEEAEKKKAEVKRAEKLSRAKSEEEVSEQTEQHQSEPDLSANLSARALASEEASAKEEASSQKPVAVKKKSKFVKKKQRSAKYKTALLEIDKDKIYSIQEGIELLKKVKLAKFDETVELHINTTEAGISGQVKLPHGTGKEIRISIATDEVLAEVEKGKINFDILIAEPTMMPKLARVAKVLGPKGLMPNPKNGTISDKPEEAAKKFQGGQISFKTESKLPVMHLTVGKMSFGDDKLSENIRAMIDAIRKDRITKITLKSTMSPAIKLAV